MGAKREPGSDVRPSNVNHVDPVSNRSEASSNGSDAVASEVPLNAVTHQAVFLTTPPHG